MFVKLIKENITNFQKRDDAFVLKTDLWNEGIEQSLGNIKNFIEKKNFQICAIDVSPFICRLGRSYMKKKVAAICSDITTIPLVDSSIDFIFDLSTIDHLQNFNLWKVIREYSRICKKNGFLIIIFHHTPQIPIFFLRLYQHFTKDPWLKQILENTFLLEKKILKNLLNRFGFIIKKETPIHPFNKKFDRLQILALYYMILALKI
jgi:ubiquinone/menaquinone biosynthesis C-methylase UbiE